MVRVSISAGLDEQPGSRLRRRGVIGMLLASLTLCSTGCTVFNSVGDSFRYNSVWNDAATKMRHRSMSSKSWHHRKHQYCNEGCLDDFCAGYRQGFEDVAGGGTGCTPNFPPRDYWGWQHQSAEGQKKVSAWFAGYPHGARAAEEDGIGNWAQVQMSSGLQAEYVRSGMLPNKGHAVYPITAESNAAAGKPAGKPVSAPAAGPATTPVAPSAHVYPVPMQGNPYAPAAGMMPVNNSIVLDGQVPHS